MEDISHHITSNCLAVAQIEIQMDTEAWQYYDLAVLASVRVAVELAVKNAASVIPGVHPALFDAISLSEQRVDDTLIYELSLKAIHKTSIDNQALYGAYVAGISLAQIHSAKGSILVGTPKIVKSKNPYQTDKRMYPAGLTAAVVVCSDSISQGTKSDSAGKAVIEVLQDYNVKVNHYQVIPDEKERITACVEELSKDQQLLIFTGGTGLSFRDVTPEALEPLLERRIPGIEEAIRAYGQQRVPYAMLSRSVVGTFGNCLIMAIPGSTNGARESMQAVFPHILHVFKILRGQTQH